MHIMNCAALTAPGAGDPATKAGASPCRQFGCQGKGTARVETRELHLVNPSGSEVLYLGLRSTFDVLDL